MDQDQGFEMNAFIGKSCFHIAHSASCAGLFIPNSGGYNLTLRNGTTVKMQCYRVSTAHPIYKSMISEYFLESKHSQSNRTMEDEDASKDESDGENADQHEFQDCIAEEKDSV